MLLFAFWSHHNSGRLGDGPRLIVSGPFSSCTGGGVLGHFRDEAKRLPFIFLGGDTSQSQAHFDSAGILRDQRCAEGQLCIRRHLRSLGEKEDTSRATHGVSPLRVFQQVHQRPRAHEGSGQASHHRLPQALMYVNNVESARLGLAVTFGQK